jgi:AhpC/TSA family protein
MRGLLAPLPGCDQSWTLFQRYAKNAYPWLIFLTPLRGVTPDSMLRTNTDTLHAGDTAPDFALPTAERNIVRLSDYRGKPLVLVFIRGTW